MAKKGGKTNVYTDFPQNHYKLTTWVKQNEVRRWHKGWSCLPTQNLRTSLPNHLTLHKMWSWNSVVKSPRTITISCRSQPSTKSSCGLIPCVGWEAFTICSGLQQLMQNKLAQHKTPLRHSLVLKLHIWFVQSTESLLTFLLRIQAASLQPVGNSVYV